MKKIHDVALSFASEERAFVEEVAILLREFGVKVFYDNFETASLWGKDLYQYLHEIYFSSKYTVVFLSSSYREKLWTKHELRAMQSRAFQEKNEYILPIYMEKTEIPGLPQTLGHIDAKKKTPIDIALLILEKITHQKRATSFFSRHIDFDKENFYNDVLQKISSSRFSSLISVYKDGARAIEIDHFRIGHHDAKFRVNPVIGERNVVSLDRSVGFCGFKCGLLYLMINHRDYPPTTYLLKPFSGSRETILSNNAFLGICLDVSARPFFQAMSSRVLFVRTSDDFCASRYQFTGSDIFDQSHPIVKNSISKSDSWLHSDHLRAPDLAKVKKIIETFNAPI